MAPAGRGLEAGDHAQGRGLAAARRAEQREELARGDREAGVVDRHEVAEALGDVVDLDDRRGRVRPTGAVGGHGPGGGLHVGGGRSVGRGLVAQRMSSPVHRRSRQWHVSHRATCRIADATTAPQAIRSSVHMPATESLAIGAALGDALRNADRRTGRDGGDSDGTRELHRRGVEARRARAPPTRCSTRPPARSSPRCRRATPPTSTPPWPPRPRRSPPGAAPRHASAARSCSRWPTPSRTTSTS